MNSTRIKNLVAGATEIQLGLLSQEESIEMLVSMSGISVNGGADSPELMKLVHLCGRLPLTIAVVAGMMSSFGDDWQDNVSAMLQDDMSGSLAEAGTGLSPAEVIVNRSVKELQEADAIEMFSLLAILPEGVHPLHIFVCILRHIVLFTIRRALSTYCN